MMMTRIHSIWVFALLGSCCVAQDKREQSEEGPTIAVIGGGISGTFVSKYLMDYYVHSSSKKKHALSKLDIYDPYPIGEYYDSSTASDGSSTFTQGSRIRSLSHNNHTLELGASIATTEFRHVYEMAASGGLEWKDAYPKQEGEGSAIYNGDGSFAMNTVGVSEQSQKLKMMWRYNLDAWKLFKATARAQEKYATLGTILNDTTKLYASPQGLYQAAKLWPLVTHSLEQFANVVDVYSKLPFWRYYLYNQGSFLNEVATAINLVNYHQNASQVNAISGLGSLSGMSSNMTQIVGGNMLLIKSAFEQAQQLYQSSKASNTDNPQVIQHVKKRVSTVVGSVRGFDLYSDESSDGEGGGETETSKGDVFLGHYDLVILAVPLTMAQIDFYIQSHMDETVLQPMPLGKLVKPSHSSDEEDTTIPPEHTGHEILPQKLPPILRRPYVQVVTTFVANGSLKAEYFRLDSAESSESMRAIYMTDAGKAAEYNITSIARQSGTKDIYKIFSSSKLEISTIQKFLGENATILKEQVWGGRQGGATPDYRGRAETTGFILWDGATGLQGHTYKGALYYPNAMEVTFSNMETCAIGAKAVAKLAAYRLGWFELQDEHDLVHGDEL